MLLDWVVFFNILACCMLPLNRVWFCCDGTCKIKLLTKANCIERTYFATCQWIIWYKHQFVCWKEQLYTRSGIAKQEYPSPNFQSRERKKWFLLLADRSFFVSLAFILLATFFKQYNLNIIIYYLM